LKLLAKYLISLKKMKYLFVVFYLFFLIYPAKAVSKKMFKVLDTCARYRLGELNANEAIEKLKLTNSSNQPKDLVKKYCWVFTQMKKLNFNFRDKYLIILFWIIFSFVSYFFDFFKISYF